MAVKSTWEDIALPILKDFADGDQKHGRLRFQVSIPELAEEIGEPVEQVESEVYRLRDAGYINFTSTLSGDICYSCELLPAGAREVGMWPSE